MHCADKLSTLTRMPAIDSFRERVRASLLGILPAMAIAGMAATAAPSQAAGAPVYPLTPVAVPAPPVADTWFETRFVRTKAGPRVCPPGVPVSNSLIRPCERNATLMTPREYFTSACPNATLLSVMPYSMQTIGSMVFGYTEGRVPCMLPVEARRP